MLDAGTILTALGLVLVLEGLLPFLAPGAYRDTVQRVAQMRDGQLRFLGLAAILGGLLLVAL